MSIVAIVYLALVSILLLTSLVMFGVGHKRWSVVSVVASFLVVMTLGGYLYLAARLLDFEWRWVQKVRSTQLRIDEVRDAERPSNAPGRQGRLEKIAGGKSLVELRAEHQRWQRALERTANWRGRYWEKASFTPPTSKIPTGSIVLPAPVAVEAAGGDDGIEPAEEGEPAPAAAQPTGQPLDPGATVYVFDDTPATEGGRYLGSFRVMAIANDGASGLLKLTLEPTAPPDSYDKVSWGKNYDAVTVYDQLPADRWLAFSQVSRMAPVATAVDDQIAPQPEKRPEEDLTALVPQPFLEGVERHALSAADASGRETVDEADWPALRQALESGEKLPGEVWAEVVFEDQIGLDDFLKLDRDDLPGGPDALTAEVEFGEAEKLVEDGKATIRKVFYRRRLIDAETLVDGRVVPGGGEEGDLMTDGLMTLMQGLQQDIAVLEASNQRLTMSKENVTDERKVVRAQADELNADLAIWDRDVESATKLADAFEAEAKRVAAELEKAEQEVVRLGREYDDFVEKAVQRIDRIAPPPQGRGAATPNSTF